MFNNELWQKPAGGAGGAGFYTHQIANSCRFIRADASKLSRALGTATANTKWTFSSWVKPSSFPTGTTDQRGIFGATGSTYGLGLVLSCPVANEPQLLFLDYPSGASGPNAGGVQTLVYLKRLFRDPNAWYHIVVNQDTTQSTASDRIKFYINGELQTDFDNHTSGGSPTPFYPSQNSATINDSIHTFLIGVDDADNSGASWDGYMAETYFIDGTAYAASDFGESKNGVWIPKDASGLTFGNNGFYLKYESSSNLGNDSSGNNNDYTVSNISAHDQMLDSPTFNSDSNGGNFATLGPLWKTPDMTFSEGNLKWTCSTNQRGAMSNWSIPLEGKYYFEYVPLSWGASSGDDMWLGLNVSTVDFTASRGGKATCYGYGANSGKKIDGDGTEDSYGASWGTNDIIGVAVDRVNDTIQFSKNGSFQGSAFAIPATADLFPWVGSGGGTSSASGVFNFGQDGTFAGSTTAGGNSDDTGYGNFKYSVPSGFKALCQGNLPTNTSISPAETDDNYPQKLFSAILYTGNGGTNNITGLGFQPDWTWIKERGGANDHKITDSTRGVTKAWESNTGNAETTDTNGLTAFGTDGFTVGSDAVYNNSSDTYVAWNWRLNGGTTAVNTVGGTSSVTQVDPSGSISVVTYTGFAGSSGSSTVGHGMSLAPEMVIHVSRYGGGAGWWTQAPNVLTNAGYFLNLNSTGAQTDLNSYGTMNAPTTSVFTINGVEGVGGSSRNYVAYCFANIEGFCKVGSYVGNGNDDGTFVYTGFRPAMMIIKELVVDDWLIYDDKRVGYNNSSAGNAVLYPNGSYAEENQASRAIDILSNGFKLRTSNATGNAGSGNYIYLAIAKNPFQFATAR